MEDKEPVKATKFPSCLDEYVFAKLVFGVLNTSIVSVLLSILIFWY